jgi:hypothetical protein
MEPASDPLRQRLTEWRRRLLASPPLPALPIESPSFDTLYAQILDGEGEVRVGASPQEITAWHRSAREVREQADLHLPHLAIGVLPPRDEGETFVPLLLLPVEVEPAGRHLSVRAGPGGPAVNPAVLSLPHVDDWRALRPSAWLDEAERALHDDGLTVERRACLALVPLGRWLLAQQLEAEQAAIARHPLVRALTGEQAPPRPLVRGATRRDEDDPCASPRAWPTDPGQEAALKAAARPAAALLGVGGPAGSGRTQVIANLLAASIVEGKTVLLVGRTPAGLEAVRQRLGEAGLDRYCLTLRGGAADGSALLGELRRALAAAPQAPPAAPEPGDGAGDVRARLAEYVRELHDPRWPLDRSAADVLTELSGLAAAPELAWRNRHPELLTSEQLAESLALVERLAPLLDLAREPEAAPWERCREPGEGEEAAEEWRGLLSRAQAASHRLRQASSALATSHGLPAPASPAEVERILDLDAWLLRDPPTPDHWLTELDVPAAREEAEWWQERMGAYLAERARLMVGFDPALLALPEDVLEDLEQAARRLELLLGVNAGTTLAARPAVNSWIAATQAALPRWRDLAQRLAGAVGLSDLPLTLESALRLAGLARVLGRPERPPAHWIDRRACAQVESALREAGELQQRLHKVRRAVLSVYASSVTEIAAEPLIADYVAHYGGRWRFLRPGYHRTLRLLRQHRLDHQTPPNPLSDLRKIRFFRHCRSALEALSARHGELLGDYAPTLLESLTPARKALETARELLERAGAVDVEAITRRAHGDPLPTEAAAWAADLERAIEQHKWQTARCQGALPTGPLPGHGVPLRQLPFDELEVWLAELADALTGLDERLVRLRALLVGGDASALGFEEALDALIRLAGLRSFERKLEAESAHLRSVYGALFRGLETDWPGVLDALDAVENAREVYGGNEGGRGGSGVPPRLEERRRVHLGVAEDPAQCRQLLRELESLVDELDGRFEQAHSRRRYPVDRADPWAVTEGCLARLDAWVDQREDWVELARLRQDFEIAELAWLFQELRAPGVPPAQAVAAVQRAALLAWWQAQRADSPGLRGFDVDLLEADIADFRDAQGRCQQRARREAIEAAEARRPLAEVLDGVGGEAAAMDLRALTLQLRDTLRLVKPVVMACPFTAARLPREMLFDRVLVHETGPIPVEEVVGAVARGRQVVVFGPPPPSGPSANGLLADMAAAGVVSLPLSGDYRDPAQADAPLLANSVREQVARAVRELGYDVVERAGPGAGAVLLWVSPPGGEGKPLLAIDATDADPEASWRTVAERYAILPGFVERLGCPLHRVHTPQWANDRAAAVGALRQALPPATGRVEEATPYEVASLDGFGLEPAALHDPLRREAVMKALRHLVSVEGPVHSARAVARIVAACGRRPGGRRQPALEKALGAALQAGWIEERGDFLHAPGGSPLRVRTPRAGDPSSRRRLDELPPEEIVLAAQMLLRAGGRQRRSALGRALTGLFGLSRTTRRTELERILRAAGASRLEFSGELVALRPPM